jgi:hypothetical protein
MFDEKWKNKMYQLRQIKSHILSLIHFHAFEDDKMKPVHFQRLIPPIQRLIKSDFFGGIRDLIGYESNETETLILLDWLSSLGEIAKLANGYYLPLPLRTVQLPVSKTLILLSNMGEPKTVSSYKYYGCGSGYVEDDDKFPMLTIGEWMPSLTISEFIQILKSQEPIKLAQEPTEIFLPQKKRKWYLFHENLVSQVELYIAKYTVKYSEPLYFWVERKKHNTCYYKIPTDYLDIAKYALENKANIKITTKCTRINEDLMHVRLTRRLTSSEEKMLMLFAFPLHLIRPYEWIVPLRHYTDFVWVLNRLGIEVG